MFIREFQRSVPFLKLNRQLAHTKTVLSFSYLRFSGGRIILVKMLLLETFLLLSLETKLLLPGVVEKLLIVVPMIIFSSIIPIMGALGC